MNVSDELYEFHKKYEGYRKEPYKDVGGVLTIGVGHANQDTEPFDEDSVWDDDKIHEVWLKDIHQAVNLANEWTKNFEVSQVFFDALVDLAFNVGKKPKSMLSYLADGNEERAREELLRWVYVGKKAYLGLIRRRFAMYLYTLGENWDCDIDKAITMLNYSVERDASQGWKILRL